VELNKTQVAAGAAVGQRAVKELRERQTYEKDKKLFTNMFFSLFSNNVVLEYYNKNCRKPF